MEVPGGLEELPGRRHPVGPEDPGLGRQLPLGNKSGGGRGAIFLIIAFGLVRLSLLKWAMGFNLNKVQKYAYTKFLLFQVVCAFLAETWPFSERKQVTLFVVFDTF